MNMPHVNRMDALVTRVSAALLLFVALFISIEWVQLGRTIVCPPPETENRTGLSNRIAKQHKDMLRFVVVTICNQEYATRAIKLVEHLRNNGGYTGDIVVLHFGVVPALRGGYDDRVFLQSAEEIMGRNPPQPPCIGDGSDSRRKRINASPAYYYKAAIFSKKFFATKWDTLLYLDSRMNIHLPSIHSFFDAIDSTGVLMGQIDSWPSGNWKFHTQFAPECNASLFESLTQKYDLNYPGYFQTGVVLLDTSILHEDTLDEIQELFHTYAQVISNSDQCIFNLYWGKNMHNLYRPLPYLLQDSLLVPYDYFPLIADAQYVITANRPD